MKKTMMMLMVGLMFAGSVGCSSAPKEETSSEPTMASEEIQPTETVSEQPQQPASDLSLGAGSSGRGH